MGFRVAFFFFFFFFFFWKLEIGIGYRCEPWDILYLIGCIDRRLLQRYPLSFIEVYGRLEAIFGSAQAVLFIPFAPLAIGCWESWE
ncbi:uncharacterized protein GGS25DRAFT_474800 [Hypoxylon fragiforme]|uniref:uncharacterized protein n=1 Tax=Hypoxylon fragiforme TaxID=63214 RepID=UPI0020C7166B|nr:uncharacterized protein GGS25DRAFT_474800 [Hypoxylon fragiforme]KAI2612308.1 hypothetical protein GGS25DRAFT_474800 [Hypoxylon fragiforme]